MSKRAVAIIIAGFFTVFVAFSIRYCYGLLLPQMLSSLSISKTEAGVIFSSYFITYTILSPVLGLLGDRTDARILLTIFVTLLGLGAYLMSFSSTVVQASFFFALAGVGHSACWAPVATVVLRWISDKRRGIVLSIVDLGSATGIGVWSILIPLITAAYSWRAVWVILGVITFLAAGMNFLVVQNYPPFEVESRGSGGTPETRISIRKGYMAIFRDTKFHLVGLSYLFISFSILIPFTFLTAYGTQELKISYSSAAALVAVIGVSGAAGKLILGHISDIVGRLRVMMLCGALTAVGCLGLAYAHEFLMLILFSVVFGVGYGTIWAVYAASARDMFSKDYSGSIIGLWTVYHGLGSVLSPVIAGWTIDATGTYFWALILAAIASILSLLLLWPLGRTGSGPQAGGL
ncbi:MAG: MFS transporter [Deltaproteobacteria bacterium]|nr:MFS transporter [Deltaproteobacteria bacterium]MBW2136890.1 MFS transporter [Deltaproteobacteria bacterium]